MEFIMNYVLVKNPISSKKSNYTIIEEQTNKIVKSSVVFNDVKKLVKHLNCGGGFDGWSPDFFFKQANITFKR